MSEATMKILILGGYGTFGGTLAKLLANEPKLTLIIAGRSHSKAEAFCKRLSCTATLVPMVLDRDGELEAEIKETHPDIVVDASGPFQAYGAEPYRVVKACLNAGVHYLDLADGSDFVKAIGQFDEAARARNIFILSGVSSFPVLTAAVVRTLSQGMKTIHSITGGIAPSPYAGVGLNVIRAVMSYAGQPISLIRGGEKSTAHALTESMRYTICPPGYLPLRNLRFSLVDVPDLQLLPDLWQMDSIWMGVGPVPEILHRMLNGLSFLVKKGLVPSLLPYASLFYRVINILRWGEHRGGMFVSVTGSGDNGVMLERSWHLLAEGNDGPLIPSMAAEAIIRHALAGKTPATGARAATRELELSDYDLLFKNRTIYTGCRNMNSPSVNAPLYQKILDEAWHQLPEPLRALHTLSDQRTVSGMASVERGSGLLSRMVAALVGFPEAGDNVPVSVTFKRQQNREIWRRNFNGASFSSIQLQGKDLSGGLLEERFGPLRFGLALVLKDARLHLVTRRWSFLGIALPAFLAPTGDSYEYEEDGRFRFHVEIAHPFTGLIVRYRGWLAEVAHA